MKTIDPVVQKHIAEIKAAGESAYREGAVTLFGGFPESLKHRAVVAAFGVIEQSPVRWEIMRMIETDDMAVIADKDFPLHALLFEADSDPDRWQSLDALWRDIDRYFMTNEDCARLTVGSELHFTEIVADASGDVLLLAGEIAENVRAMRSDLAGLFGKYGLHVRPLDHVLAVTLIKLKSWSARTVPDALRAFRENLEAVADRTRTQPVSMKVTRFFRGSAFEMLTRMSF
ncbi:MAG: hypothetical protein QOG91_160 [Candidatus Parcubacteria bacterium]|jgi:hypothetical protein|nr:hypothetical protein [Candidatus Parcubacteria bacterium]